MLFIFLLSSLLFLFFFIKIWFLYWIYLVIFLISIILILSFFSNDWQNNWKDFFKSFFLEYIMYINFFVIVLWVFFMLKYFFLLYDIWEITNIKAIMSIIWIVSTLIIISTLLNKQNFLKISFFGLFILWCILFFLVKDINIFYYSISHINSLAIVSYLIYFSIYWKIDKYTAYIIFIFTITLLFIILNNYFIHSQIILSFTIQFVIFCILSFIIYTKNLYQKLLSIQNKIQDRENEIKLFGYSELKLENNENDFLNKHTKYENFYKFLKEFFIESPKIVKILFSLTNTIPIILASWVFFHQLESINRIQNEIFYWLGAIMYFINFLLFKKLDWFVIIQRLFAFFVINFVTYFTIIDFSWNNYLYIAIWWIIWNLFATIIILFLDNKHNTFWAMDYLIWTIVNFIWLFVNIYFLFKIWLNYYLSVWIALLYLGIYLFLYRIIYKKYFLID